MKKDEVPQDITFLTKITKELCYVKNETGKYESALSTGWQVKHEALVEAWEDINKNNEEALKAVLKGEKSPIYYFMLLNLMDISLLASYTGFWKFTIRRHMKPAIFNKLSNKKLNIYAKVFDISVEQLKNITKNE
ncbi:MAG: hypothetical protein PHT69_01745 [Bacteroidales bacterium]|nr:hypothetical protein [Bacteroidales bacterium]